MVSGPRSKGEVRIGISGWNYPRWRQDFYPPGLPQRLELEYASEHLSSIEINGSFYALQRPTTYLAWRNRTPSDFVFSVKAPRFITHMKRLVDVETPLANFFASGLLALGAKLGPVLWQLPPNLTYDAERMRGFFALLPRTTAEAAKLTERRDAKVPDDRAFTTYDADRPVRHALEVRHPSLASAEALEVARAAGVAVVLADAARKWPVVETLTADFAYARLHGAEELYASGYTDGALETWADRVADWRDRGIDSYIYFDNDAKVRAPYDAMSLIAKVEAR